MYAGNVQAKTLNRKGRKSNYIWEWKQIENIRRRGVDDWNMKEKIKIL